MVRKYWINSVPSCGGFCTTQICVDPTGHIYPVLPVVDVFQLRKLLEKEGEIKCLTVKEYWIINMKSPVEK